MPVIRAEIKPPGGGSYPLVLTAEPTWGAAEQGGWCDAKVPAVLDPRTRYAGSRIILHGPERPVYFGTVQAAEDGMLVCEGEQGRLADVPRGVVYVATDGAGWQEINLQNANGDISTTIDDAGRLSATFTAGTSYASGRRRGWVYTLPQPSDSVTVSLTTLGMATNYQVQLHYAVGWSRTFTYVNQITSSNTTVTWAIPATNVTELLIVVRPIATMTPASDVVVTINPTIYGTAVTNPTVAAVATDIFACAGVAAEVDASLTTVLDDIVYDAKASEQSKLTDLLRYGDWFMRPVARLVANAWSVVYLFAPRPTTPRYSLKHGPGVACDLTTDTIDPLVRTVNAHYTDKLGRPRYASAVDSDASHTLVYAGLYRTANIDVDTTSATNATAAANRYLADASRPQVTGTITIDGAPNGISACEYEVGELVSATDDTGTYTVRITSAEYTGAHHAVLTVDNTPSLDDLLFRANLGGR